MQNKNPRRREERERGRKKGEEIMASNNSGKINSKFRYFFHCCICRP
jgi:hypothetical protein